MVVSVIIVCGEPEVFSFVRSALCFVVSGSITVISSTKGSLSHALI